MGFLLGHVIEVASQHPFYSTSKIYPLTPKDLEAVLAKRPPSNCSSCLLSKLPVTCKEDIYNVVARLASDDKPDNTFRQSTYISVTGGGGGSSFPLAFFTDIAENRLQRQSCGELLRRTGAIGERDCVLSMHACGSMYRALDLTTEVMEHAGASVLPAGHRATPEELLTICRNFRPNVLAGDASQIVQFASFVDSMGVGNELRVLKILYTSEPMTRIQKSYITSVFTHDACSRIEFISLLASAEMGVWAVGNFAITGPQVDDSADFIYDSRHMLVETLPLNYNVKAAGRNYPCALEEDKLGLLVVTSLQRLRNPLVRYITGDIGSVHQLPAHAKSQIGERADYLRILRLSGRDTRHSFNWEGEYFDIEGVKNLMSDPAWGVVRWQIILANDVLVPGRISLELRMMRARDQNCQVSQGVIIEKLRDFFFVGALNESLFQVTLSALDKFIRSASGNKIILFVDRR